MIAKRLISAILDQMVILSTVIESLTDDAVRYSYGHEVEGLLKRANLNMARTCSSLNDLEREMIRQEEEKNRDAT